MHEMNNLLATCQECDHQWYPYGRFTKMGVPHTAITKCPKCGNKGEVTWLDSETDKKLVQQRLGLLENSPQKIKDLEHKVELLTKEIELEKKKRELFEAELEQFEYWAEDREEDFLHIEQLAKELDDEKKFKEDNK